VLGKLFGDVRWAATGSDSSLTFVDSGQRCRFGRRRDVDLGFDLARRTNAFITVAGVGSADTNHYFDRIV
jgi:hypothetical protein